MKKKQKDRQLLGYCQKAKKAVEHESDGNTNCSWFTLNGPQSSEKKTEESGTRDQRKNQEHAAFKTR